MSTTLTKKKKKKVWQNPFVAELRKLRDERAKQFNYDSAKMSQDLLDRQEAMEKAGWKFVDRPCHRYEQQDE
ncbi:MAG: hypothetical protein ACRC46_12260 [Thermoguttaceae bacterium]